MNTRPCSHCGHSLPERAKFCGQCGALTPLALASTAPATPSAKANTDRPAPTVEKTPGVRPVAAHTMILYSTIATPPAITPTSPRPPTNSAPVDPSPHPSSPPLAAPQPAKGVVDPADRAPAAGDPSASGSASPTSGAVRLSPMKQTMLGLAVATTPTSPASPSRSPSPSAPATRNVGRRTMLGVAIPGIAPLRPGHEAATPPPAEPPTTNATPGVDERPRGVDAPPPPIVPAPAPLFDAPPPPPPRIVRKEGVPLVAVALVASGIVVAGGVAISLLWHRAPPVAAVARVTPEGTDVLHLTCDPSSCADGTVAELDGASATFAGGASDLPLAHPLHIGDNPLTLHIDRPGMGRDELLSLVVPVAYRVRADVGSMRGPHPSIVIHVDALPGSLVRISGDPIALDATGLGSYSIDESIATEGASDESRIVSIDVPYTVAAAGHPPNDGTVSARVAIAPLRVDVPGPRATVEADHVLLAGRAAKGASVTIDGAAVPVAADGSFETTLTLNAPGETVAEVRSGTPALAPRTIHVTLKRVASLRDEAKDFEKHAPLGYDAALSNLATDAGQLIVVDGEVVEPRRSGHRTLLLVDDRRGCARAPCLVRVIVGQELAAARGDRVRAFGRIARAFTTPGGQTVPEVEADFATVPKR